MDMVKVPLLINWSQSSPQLRSLIRNDPSSSRRSVSTVPWEWRRQTPARFSTLGVTKRFPALVVPASPPLPMLAKQAL
ncbi:MAG TPA: hypothetical protein VGL86_19720, partial [Polyangia bacterium]